MMATVSLRAGRARSAWQRHPWVFSGALQRVPAEAPDGGMVRVVDESGDFVAYGYLNRASQITVRLLSWDERELPDEHLLFRRLERAVAWRRQRFGWPAAGACRLVYAESDGLPGLIVDRYADWLVVQFLTLGSEAWRTPLIDWLVREIGPRGIYERSDVDVREKEGLEERTGPLWGEPPPSLVEIAEGDCRFLVDLVHGQKTGFFLDQRLNRQIVASYGRDREVLDAFCYTGGFGICLTRAGAREVWYADSSAEALGLAERNAQLNGIAAPADRFVQRDIFQLLREYSDRARRFDMIVLDPPKFAYAQAHVERACRGYKDINRLAMQLLRPDGILATFSCSGAVGIELFQKVIFAAALDAGRDVQIVQVMTQAPDHPVLVYFPEGAYLKGFICRVS